MATVQEPRPRHRAEKILEAHLNRARQQVRYADLTVAILGLVAYVLGFGLAMILLDRWLEFPAVIRQLALVAFLVGVFIYLVRVVARPMWATINPYFAARQVERTLPGSKNSLINWLDLRDAPLAPTVHDAVARKAAHDFDRADIDEAMRDKRLARFGVLTGVLVAAAIIALCAFRPAQFFSLVSRTFTPFASTSIATQTTIQVIEPAAGDAVVPLHHPVTIRVELDGRIPKSDEPDAVRLRLRYNPDDAIWDERPMEEGDRPDRWSITVSSAQVRNGFEYQVTGGDASTPIQRVKVRAKPLFTDFEIRYHYPEYLRYADEVHSDLNLRANRGTRVMLLAKTNRTVSGGVLTFTAAGNRGRVTRVPAELIAGQPDSLKYVLTLDQSGSYRLKFDSADGESTEETMPFTVEVKPDLPPQVELLRPLADKVAVNGTLTLAARATDDFGLAAARLKLSLKPTTDGPAQPLPDAVYRNAAAFQVADGTLARSLEFKEVVAIEKLKDEAGRLLNLKPGMILTCQWEADDNCTVPGKQTGKSKIQEVTLVDPQQQQERNAERDRATEEKKQHDQNQDQDNSQKTDGGAGPPPEQPDPQQKPGEQNKSNDQQPMDPNEQKTLDQAKKINDALNQDQPLDPNQANDGKPDGQGNQPQPKDGANNKPNDGKSDGQGNQPQPKDGKPDGQGNPAQPKDGANNKPSDGKPDGQGNQPQPKDGKTEGQGNPAQPKDGANNKPSDGKPDGQGNQPQPKDGKSDGQGKQSQNKDGSDGNDTQAKTGNPTKTPDGKAMPDNKPKNAGMPDDKQPPDKAKPDGKTQPNQRENGNNSKPTQDDSGKAQPGEKATDTPESKPGDKNERTGQKNNNKGQKNDKPNDQAPSTSPDKGNADGGQPGSQRATEGPKDGAKMDTPKENAISGSGKPDAKPDEKQPDGANNQGKEPGKEPSKGRPDQGQGKQDTTPKNPSDQTTTQDAAKPHEKAGEKPSTQPKTPGTDAQGQKPGDQKPDTQNAKPQTADGANPPKPTADDVKKLVEQFKNADPKTQREIVEKLKEKAKSAKSPQERKQAEDAAQKCEGECDNPSNGGGKAKPSDQAKGQGDSSNPGQKPDGEKPGLKPGDTTAKQPDAPGQDKSTGNGRNNPANDQGKSSGQPGNQAGPGEKPGDHPPPRDDANNNKNAGNKGMATGNRQGAGDVDGTPSTPAAAPNSKYLGEAGELQLENFKKIDKKTRERLKMTDEEYQQFLKAYEQLVKKSKAPAPKNPADRVRGSATGKSAGNASARKVDAMPKSGPKTDSGASGQAPPEFREQYKEFTKDQSPPKSKE